MEMSYKVAYRIVARIKVCPQGVTIGFQGTRGLLLPDM